MSINHNYEGLTMSALFRRKKSLSFSDLWTFIECPEEYLARLLRKTQKRTKEGVVGEATHAIAEQHGETTDEIRRFIEKEVSALPEEEREETVRRIELVSANAQEMAEDDPEDDEDTDRESVYKWFFEQVGWTLCAKPDKVDYVEEDGRQIMEITDYKSGSSHEYHDENGTVSYRAKRKHREQIYFFAMVVSLALNWNGPIRLRIRYWGNKSECKPLWYSRRRTNEALAEVAAQIKRIETCIEEARFPAKPGFWCKNCPLAQNCEANLAHQRILSGNRPLAEPAREAACA